MSDRAAAERDGHGARARVIEAASRLLAQGGVSALTTRAVAAAAQVQAPTLYRLFGEKRGLLDAVAEHRLASFVAQKAAGVRSPDPVQDLRDAWDTYVAFGLANPAVFAIMNETGAPAASSPATLAGLEVLRERVARIARAGRLGTPVELAVSLIHAAGVGVVTTLLATEPEARDPTLSSMAREAVLARVISDQLLEGVSPGVAPLAVALQARLDEAAGLSPGERLLLDELLGRLSSAA